MTEPLFNYKVLTDSTTNEDFYCINIHELKSLVQETSMYASEESYITGYKMGCLAGSISIIILILLYKLFVKIITRNVENDNIED